MKPQALIIQAHGTNRDKQNSLASLTYFKTESTGLDKILETDIAKYINEKMSFLKSEKDNLRQTFKTSLLKQQE